MNICVVGSGYVGLVTGACLAEFGNNVTCVDNNSDRIDALKRGKIPFYEPGLPSIVAKNIEEGRLHFTDEEGPAIEQALVVFIAVGTPSRSDGSANLIYIDQVATTVARHLDDDYKVVVTKSTVPAGTGQRIKKILTESSGKDSGYAVVSNPEFLREGSAIGDFLHPDRVVIGSHDPKALEIMRKVYSPLTVRDVEFVETDIETAELIKYASNGFLATKISFINEMAALCEVYGADVGLLAHGMGLDKRIGPQFLHPGPGFGGSCFPKDSRALGRIATDRGQRFQIIDAVLAANQATKDRMVEKIDQAVGGLKDRMIAVLGLAFKSETDDIRESPAVEIVKRLLASGATVRAYDPKAMDNCREEPGLEGLDYATNAYEAADGADALVILTEWDTFVTLELSKLRKALKRPLVIDLRNIYPPERMFAAGFHYVSVGRPEARGERTAAADDGEKDN